MKTMLKTNIHNGGLRFRTHFGLRIFILAASILLGLGVAANAETKFSSLLDFFKKRPSRMVDDFVATHDPVLKTKRDLINAELRKCDEETAILSKLRRSLQSPDALQMVAGQIELIQQRKTLFQETLTQIDGQIEKAIVHHHSSAATAAGLAEAETRELLSRASELIQESESLALQVGDEFHADQTSTRATSKRTIDSKTETQSKPPKNATPQTRDLQIVAMNRLTRSFVESYIEAINHPERPSLLRPLLAPDLRYSYAGEEPISRKKAVEAFIDIATKWDPRSFRLVNQQVYGDKESADDPFYGDLTLVLSLDFKTREKEPRSSGKSVHRLHLKKWGPAYVIDHWSERVTARVDSPGNLNRLSLTPVFGKIEGFRLPAKIHTSPSSTSLVVAKVAAGEVFRTVPSSLPWWKVETKEGKHGYLPNKLIKTGR